MTLDSAAPDAPDRLAIRVEVPWSGTDAEFRARVETPLRDLLARTDLAFSLRSHPRAARLQHPDTAALELHIYDPSLLAFILTHLRHLGAPPETSVEVETGNAVLQTTLAKLEPRPDPSTPSEM